MQGMLAEQVCLNAEGLVHFPAHLSYEEAAALPCAAVTAWNGLVEASGGVTLDNAPAYAAAGADLISVGAITHSAPILDLGLDLVED